MAHENQPVIAVNDVSFSYGHEPVLENLSFAVNEREIVTVIGPNGGGKTTLLRLILGLLEPRTGTILVRGLPPRLARREIGYVPQYQLFDRKFPVTVMDVVLSGRIRTFGYYSARDRLRATEALDDVGLARLSREPFSALSGGQSQRMLIARALAGDTGILLLDEPTSNIDPSAGKNLTTLLKKLSEKMTILLVTHDTGFVMNVTDRVFCVNRTIVEHPVDEKFSEIVASAYGNQALMVRHDAAYCAECGKEGHGHE